LKRLASAAAGVTPERYRLAAGAAAAAVFLVYVLHAVVLIRYPWDWSPDEGLFLDYAWRMIHAPSTLYPRDSSVPFPLAWTPLLPALLTPIVSWLAEPLAGARLLALAWTVAIAAGVYVLARGRAGGSLGLAAAALAVAPMSLTFWYMLVRMDGLMVALWVWTAVILLPPSLGTGGGRLGWGRAFAGAALLTLSFLAKPTAAIHAAPLVLVWLAVDRWSAFRAATAAAVGGSAAVAALQIATSGGFLRVQGLWKRHPWYLFWIDDPVLAFVGQTAPLLLGALVVLLLVLRARRGGWRDPALALWAGGVLIVPALGKYGAESSYLLPLVPATAVLAARWLGAWSEAAGSAEAERRRRAWAAFGCSALAAVTVSCARFPLPTAEDRAAAETFYRVIEQRGGPILALRPEYAYFRLRQPAEVEGSSFVLMLLLRVKGIEVVPRRIEAQHYRTIVYPPHTWHTDRIAEFVHRYYREVGYADLGMYYGRVRWLVLVPREDVGASADVTRGPRVKP
jgi:hypothetical protein